MDLRGWYYFYLTYLASLVLDSKSCQRLQLRNSNIYDNDDVLAIAYYKITSMIDLRLTSMISTVWRPELLDVIKSHPKCYRTSIPITDLCEACHRPDRTTSARLTFSGKPYDKHTFRILSNEQLNSHSSDDDDDDDDDDGRSINNSIHQKGKMKDKIKDSNDEDDDQINRIKRPIKRKNPFGGRTVIISDDEEEDNNNNNNHSDNYMDNDDYLDTLCMDDNDIDEDSKFVISVGRYCATRIQAYHTLYHKVYFDYLTVRGRLQQMSPNSNLEINNDNSDDNDIDNDSDMKKDDAVQRILDNWISGDNGEMWVLQQVTMFEELLSEADDILCNRIKALNQYSVQ